MKMKLNKEQVEMSDDLEKWLEEDPFGLEEEVIMVTFKCLDCGKKDEVPDYVVEEFSFDLEKGGQVEVLCPFCEGTMIDARNVPNE